MCNFIERKSRIPKCESPSNNTETESDWAEWVETPVLLILELYTSRYTVHCPLRLDVHIVAILARSPDDPQRIRVASVFEMFSVCLFVSKFSNFLNFNVLYCTIKYYSVPKQYSGVPVRVNWNVTKYRCGSMREWIATIVLWCTLLYCIILYYTVHSTIHQNYSRGTYIIVLKYIGPHHPASLWYGD